ncbi:hypothetical protein ACIBJF_35125 [Streptomyces sp. NPDC050743]|uniref:hypothetical protein n=1 Tax=Streptomyces sp. NPDC050743 TaxID=3365634 RepID=UPI0037AF9ABE
MGQADALRDDTDADGYLYLLIRSVSGPGSRYEDAYWSAFDARFETTQFPAEYLWGPGSRSDALAWLDAEQPKGDFVDYVDRVFMLREHDGQVYPPMHPEVAAGLTERPVPRRWRLRDGRDLATTTTTPRSSPRSSSRSASVARRRKGGGAQRLIGAWQPGGVPS